MYIIIIDDKCVATYSSNEMLEAWDEATSLDYLWNSPELNDGVTQHHKVELISLEEAKDRGITIVI